MTPYVDIPYAAPTLLLALAIRRPAAVVAAASATRIFPATDFAAAANVENGQIRR